LSFSKFPSKGTLKTINEKKKKGLALELVVDGHLVIFAVSVNLADL